MRKRRIGLAFAKIGGIFVIFFEFLFNTCKKVFR